MPQMTWTPQPNEAMWNHLLLFTSKANVKKLLLGKIKSKRVLIFSDNELVDKKSSQIAHSLRQAFEYYKAADSVSINTNPLLYFYGMLSLAKALIVANDSKILLQDISYHGLTAKQNNKEEITEFLDENSWKIENETVTTKPGVFNWFSRVTMDFEFPDSTVFSMKDLMIVDPEIIDFYRSLYNESPHVQYLYDMTETHTPYTLKISPRTIYQDAFESVFCEFKKDFDFQPEILHSQALVYSSKPHITKFPQYMGIYAPNAGGRYIIKGLQYSINGESLSQYLYPELSDYLLMFILSSCVRYKQELWGQLILGEQEGSIGILNIIISNIRRRFPNFILNNLYNDKFIYGMVARWG